MTEPIQDLHSYTSFDGQRLIATGSLLVNALAVKRAQSDPTAGPVLTFDDATGRTVDLDTRGSDEQIRARLVAISAGGAGAEPAHGAVPAPRGRGRPRLGVVAREVTLLPRHWEWLASQPGGASVALRRLVEEARRGNADRDRQRAAQERAYRFMSALAGDLPGYEEAIRALFAGDAPRFGAAIRLWPQDVREHALRLAAVGS